MTENSFRNDGGAETKRRMRSVWIDAKALYVEGEAPRQEGAPHIWPTLEAVAQRFEVRHDTLRKRAGREGWGTHRRLFAARLERERRDAKLSKMAAESAGFDNTTFNLAKALAGEVAQSLRDINRLRQIREAKLRRAGEDEDAIVAVLSQGTINPVLAQRLSALAGTLSQAQRIGRLALGDTTENVNTTVQAEVEVEATMEVGGKVTHEHDFRGDPKMIAEVAKILKEAGVTND